MFSQYGPMQVSSPCVGSGWFSSRYFLAVASRSLLHLKGGLPVALAQNRGSEAG